jgi:hypothetical protein
MFSSLLLTAALAAAAAAGPPAASASDVTTARSKKARTIAKVTARLKNTSFTRFTTSGMSTFDQRLHLCADRSFIYDTVSAIEGGIVDPDVRRVEGTWKVTSASIRGRSMSAKVRGVPNEGGGAITVRIRAQGSRVTIDGNAVSAGRSDLCR